MLPLSRENKVDVIETFINSNLKHLDDLLIVIIMEKKVINIILKYFSLTKHMCQNVRKQTFAESDQNLPWAYFG